MGQLKQSLLQNISLQRCNCNIFELTETMALFAKEAGFYRFWVFFPASSLQNEVGDLPFFYISDITNSSSFNGKISRKKSMLEKFGANILNRKYCALLECDLFNRPCIFYELGSYHIIRDSKSDFWTK